MANVADLNLIQINNFPEVENPSEWIVVSDAAGLGYKISKDNFKAFLGTVTVTAPKPIGPTDGTPELDGVYIPTVTQNEAGTPIVYASFGGLEVNTAEGGDDYGTMVQFLKNGAVNAKVNTPLPIQDVSGLVEKSSIVNDLTTGGSDKVASAETVKELRVLNKSVSNKFDSTFGNNLNAESLFFYTDVDGKIVARISVNGEFFVIGLPDSIQYEFEKNPAKAQGSAAYLGDHWQILSINDEIVARISADGNLYLSGLKSSVQTLFGNKAFFANTERSERDFFSPITDRYINRLVSAQVGMAPVPFGMFPQEYTISNTAVNELVLPADKQQLVVDTPYGKDDKVIHPYIIEFYQYFRGYRYLMCITPYTAEANENPVVYGSNDLIKFEMLTGFRQPLVTPLAENYYSDNGFTYNPLTGELIMFYRHTDRAGGFQSFSLHYKSTKDGENWSEQKTILEHTDGDLMLSPSFLYDFNTKLWHMWTIYQSGTLSHRTAKHLEGPWSEPVNQSMPNTWHLEVKYIGEKFLMLRAPSAASGNLYWAISEDAENWVKGTTGLFSSNQTAMYKATFNPIIEDDTIRFDVLWCPEDTRKLFKSQTNSITIS